MRLTGPRPESGAAGPDGRAGREEGDTLLPGGALVEELRRQVEVLEALRARPPAGPEGPDGLVTTTPPEPVRFGPTTFASTSWVTFVVGGNVATSQPQLPRSMRNAANSLRNAPSRNDGISEV